VDELLHDIQRTVLLQHLLPQICGGIAVGVERIALAAIVARTIAALIERQEIGIALVEPSRHEHIGMINAEISQNAFIKLEAQFAGIAVVHPLLLGIVHRLAGVLVLQLQRKQGDAVEHQHHIHTLVVLGRIMPLPNHIADVLLIQGICRFVEMAFRLEVAHAERDAPMLEAMAQHTDEAIRIAGIIESKAELFDRIALAHAFKARPFARLGGLDEADERIGVKAYRGIVHIGGMGIAALRGEQEGFYVLFEMFFGG